VSKRELLFKTLPSIARSMASLLNASINCPPIFDGTNFFLLKCRIQSFIQFVNFYFWDIIMDGPYYVLVGEKLKEILLQRQRVNTLKMTMRNLKKILQYYMFYNVL